jgi:hypothetical protein
MGPVEIALGFIRKCFEEVCMYIADGTASAVPLTEPDLNSEVLLQMDSLMIRPKTRIPFANDKQKDPIAARAFFLLR